MTFSYVVSSYLPWLLSCLTIYMTLLAGNRHPKAWAVGLVGQFLWLGWMLVTESWGFLPMNAALWIVYGRNHWKWSRQGALTALNDNALAFELMVRMHICLNLDENIEVDQYEYAPGRFQGEYDKGVEAWIVAGWIKNDRHVLQVDQVYNDNAEAAVRKAIVGLAEKIQSARIQ